MFSGRVFSDRVFSGRVFSSDINVARVWSCSYLVNRDSEAQVPSNCSEHAWLVACA
jgi:hypothetical protein